MSCDKINVILPRFRSTSTVQLVRTSVGAYQDGRFVPGATETTEITAVLHPVNGREQQLLPQGIRGRRNIIAYTYQQISATNERTGQPADLLLYKGTTFEVFAVEDWDDHGGFYRATCTEKVS